MCELHLEENPLTCPPANLCGRGRVHIFKYLEIQAVKEDKKRGVLTDGEYRRRYCSNLLSTLLYTCTVPSQLPQDEPAERYSVWRGRVKC